MSWPIVRKIETGFRLAILVVAAIGMVSLWNNRRVFQASHRAQARTQQVLSELESLRSVVIDMHVGMRGYVTTEDQQYLKLYERAVARLHEHVQRLHDLTSDHPDQQERMMALEQRLNKQLMLAEEIVSKHRAKKEHAVTEGLSADRGKNTLSDMGMIVGEMVREVNDSFGRQAEQLDRSESYTLMTLAALVALSLLLFSAAHVLIRRDLFERQRAERALRESKERYRELFENANDIVFTLGLDENFTSANKAAEEITGYPRSSPGRMSFADVVAPEYLGLARQMIERNLKDHKPATFELEIIARDGHRVPLEVSTRLTYKDGKPAGVQGIARDITIRKQAEQALREGEERFRDLFEEAPVAYHEIDTQGIVHRVNRAECHLLGFEESQMLGRPIWEFVIPEEREKSKEAIRRKVAELQPLVPLQREYIRRDGARLVLEIHENLIRDKGGEVVGVRSALLDITERKHAEQELGRRTGEITLLSELGSLLQACTTTEEAYNVIGKFAPTLFPTARGGVCVLSASRNLVEAVVTWGDRPTGEQVFAPDACWALRSGRMHLVNDPQSPLICRHANRSAASTHLCVPMMAQGEALGVLYLECGPDPYGKVQEGLGPSKQQLAMTLAENIALALANLNLRDTLRVQSIRDPLTGLYNRRYMEESLERELRRAARNGRSLGAIMLDLDHFKRYNDTFGHDAGDAVLRELGNFLQTQVRGEDIACRYGGEEFVLILPDAAVEVVQQRAEALREGIKRIHVRHHGQSLGTVTLSLGVALFPEHGTTAESLIRAADEALYLAKAHGRDRMIVWKIDQPKPETVV